MKVSIGYTTQDCVSAPEFELGRLLLGDGQRVPGSRGRLDLSCPTVAGAACTLRLGKADPASLWSEGVLRTSEGFASGRQAPDSPRPGLAPAGH